MSLGRTVDNRVTDVPTLLCDHCGADEEPDLGWQVFSNGGVHLRAECRACGRFLMYAPQRDGDGPSVWVSMAPTRPRQEALL